MAHLRQVAQAARGHSDRSHDRDLSAGPIGPIATNFTDPEVTDDLPEFAAVLDRELDAIETHLGGSLEEMLGSAGVRPGGSAPPRATGNSLGNSSSCCDNK
jgi:hypothetical protein